MAAWLHCARKTAKLEMLRVLQFAIRIRGAYCPLPCCCLCRWRWRSRSRSDRSSSLHCSHCSRRDGNPPLRNPATTRALAGKKRHHDSRCLARARGGAMRRCYPRQQVGVVGVTISSRRLRNSLLCEYMQQVEMAHCTRCKDSIPTTFSDHIRPRPGSYNESSSRSSGVKSSPSDRPWQIAQ